jgi:hypothetical protein
VGLTDSSDVLLPWVLASSEPRHLCP